MTLSTWLTQMRSDGLIPRHTPGAEAAWELVSETIDLQAAARWDAAATLSEKQINQITHGAEGSGVTREELEWAFQVQVSLAKALGITKAEDCAWAARTHKARVFEEVQR